MLSWLILGIKISVEEHLAQVVAGYKNMEKILHTLIQILLAPNNINVAISTEQNKHSNSITITCFTAIPFKSGTVLTNNICKDNFAVSSIRI